ncbi:C2 calcium-dependent membrane targeting [Macleaya cordata]|uniref:C2 calcium-dependent membrane targeting n=1 Tax=Macleaya cordata TaxID=56857 RepID=A0A200Q623_MACCD|nr:C2 calcium-dependent membrane targeting [Macleaya cordata]
MTRGILEVLLVDACDLRNMDFFGKMDPYVLIHYGNQMRKSTIAREQGRAPVWNQKFTFDVEYKEHQQYKLNFVIMDKDTFSKDDYVGEATIYVTDVVSLGVEKGTSELKPAKYRVVLHNKKYYGEIRVGISFTRKVEDDGDKDLGGWKQSSI